MLREKIQSTIGLIEDVVDNRQKETDNAAAANRNSTFFDSLENLIYYCKKEFQLYAAG